MYNHCTFLFFGAPGNWSSHIDTASGEGQLVVKIK
jgi:hypothetical protein